MSYGIRCYENGKFSHWYQRHGKIQKFDDKRVPDGICQVVNELFEGEGAGKNCRLETAPLDSTQSAICLTCDGLGTIADEDLHANMASLPCPSCASRRP